MDASERSSRLARALAVSPLLPGCPSGTTLLTDDSSVLFPSVRASWSPPSLEGGDRRAGSLLGDRESQAPREGRAHPSLAVDLDVSATRGSGSDQLGATDSVNVGGPTIFGPARVDTDFKLAAATLAGRGGVWFVDRFGLEGLVGASVTELMLDVDSGATHDTVDSLHVGPYVGAQGTFRIVDSWTVYARAGATHSTDSTYLDSVELGTDAQLTRHVGAFAGWRWWTYANDRYSSTIRIRASGPMVGLQLLF